MKIKLKRPFSYQKTATETVTLQPGIHDLDDELAKKVLRWGKAEAVLTKKKAPEDKLAKAAENKATVEKPTGGRKRAGPKSDA